ncbi:hypothetical protein B0H14DRAFT_3444701 [Mycena olivaceomarginata]|nr:hypothetical protein B0H14DRAFT_3444701 [Mycena olivaceomarginata]
MPPQKRKNTEQPAEPPPASEDPPPVAGRTRRGGRSSPPAPPTLTTAKNASSGEPDCGFAGLSCQRTGKGAAGQIHQMQFPPQTPARRMANELASRLAQDTAMASPGPPVRDRLHADSDVEDSSEPDSDEFPINVRQRPLHVPALRTGSDSDDDTAPPSAAPAPEIHQAAKI